MPAPGPTRRPPRARRPGRLAVEPLTDRAVPSAGLLLATAGDVSNSGAPGLAAWTAGTAQRFGDPNFALEPGTTDGTFSALFNLNRFGPSDADLDALHYVRNTVTVGTGADAFALRPGDLLLSVNGDGRTLTSLNRVTADKGDVFVFRPRTGGDYSVGTFYPLLDNLAGPAGAGDVRAVALVEADTVVGDVTLRAGSFLFAAAGGGEDDDIRLFVPTGVGAGRTAGSVSVLIDGADVGITSKVCALELAEAPTDLAGRTLPAGTLLLALEGGDIVGGNAVPVTRFDVFTLAVTRTTLGSGQAVADAAPLFQGSDVGLDTSAEAVRGATILLGNAAPSAADDSYTALEDRPLTVPVASGVLADDTDPERDPLTAVLVSGPTHGTLTLNPDGSFAYAPALLYVGPDSFTYQARDPSGALSAPATASISVAPGNQPPIATDDMATAAEDMSLVGASVLANDADPNGDPLTARFVAGPTFGQLALRPDGTFTYAPAPDYNGPDSFTYQAFDGRLASAPAVVRITVSPVNDPPAAGNDTATTAEDSPVTVAVLANDTDPEGDPLTVVSVTPPANGTATTDGTTVTYTPAPDSNGTETIQYTVSDGNGGSAVGTVTLTVTPVNDPPGAAGDAFTIGAVEPLIVTGPGVLANDTDPDGDSLQAGLVAGPANGTVALGPDGGFSYVSDTGFVGTDSFTYEATDPSGLTSGPATVAITVEPATGPITAGDDSYTTPEGTPLVGSTVLANDADPGGEPLTAVPVGRPAHGTLALSPDGTFRYVPAPGYFGPDAFTYVARDPLGAESAPATVTLTVTRVNHRPVAAADGYTTPQNTALKVAARGVLANDADPDGDYLTAVLVSGPAHGTLRLRPNGSFRYVPDRGFSGPDTFTYRASDGRLGSKVVTVAIEVRPAAPAPGPPPVPPPTGGGTGPTNSGSGGTPKSTGGTPPGVTEPVLPVPPSLTGSLAAFGSPGLLAYVTSAPAPLPPAAPLPSVVVPTLPPAPVVPYLPPPVRAAVPPAPGVVAPPPVVPDTPIVPPVPQLLPDNPVFGGLDELSSDLGQGKRVQTATGTVVGTGVVATAGYVLLSPRLAYWFLSALLARRTVWKPFDPLEVVYAWEKEKGAGGGDDESLAGMVESDGGEPND